MFSIVHCRGTPLDKTNAFFCVLQEGGFEQHEEIAAGDKDFEPVWIKVCEFATTDVFKFAVDAGFTTVTYTDDEQESLKEAFEPLKEDKWLEDVYDVQSRLQSDAWVQKVSTVGNWIFNSDDTRKKLFAEASLTARH